jgi:hypothetical protein
MLVVRGAAPQLSLGSKPTEEFVTYSDPSGDRLYSHPHYVFELRQISGSVALNGMCRRYEDMSTRDGDVGE